MKKELKFVTVSIEQDSGSGNPRDEFDNLSTFYAVKNARCITGGKSDVEYNYRDSLDSVIRELKSEGAVIVPFDSNPGECFAVIERSAIIAEYKGYSLRSALYHARQCAKGEIQEFLDWTNGKVYGYIIKDNDTGQILDSCFGFYGLKYCEEEAQSQAEYYDKELAAHQAEIDRRVQWASHE